MTSAIDLAKGMIGLNGIALPQALFDHLGHLAGTLHGVGVIAEILEHSRFCENSDLDFRSHVRCSCLSKYTSNPGSL